MAQSRINKLTKIETLGVALVKRGANKKQFAITKSEQEIDMTITELLAQIIQKGEMPIDDAAVDKMCAGSGLDKQATEVFKAICKLAANYKDSPGMKKMVSQELVKMFGAMEDKPTQETPETQGTENETDESEDPQDEEDAEGEESESEESQEENKEMTGKKFPAKKSDEQGAEDMTTKTADDTTKLVQEAVAKAETEAKAKHEKLELLLKSQQDTITKMNDQIEQERDERKLAEWVAKADRDLKFVPGKTSEDLGSELHEIAKAMGDDKAYSHFTVLKSMSDTLGKSSLLNGSGSQGRGQDGKKDAYSQLLEKADQLIEKGDVKSNGLPASQVRARAVSRAMELFPALYKQYLDENQAQRGHRQHTN